jgi:UDPglucose--hexose-1-phosphate uridylyltransferase
LILWYRRTRLQGVLPAVASLVPGPDEAPRAVRTDTTLADGRDLFYYDPPGTRRVPAPDTRELPPQPHSGQARFDPRTGEWVIVATHRQTRTFLPAADACPLCPSTVDNLTEVPATDYAVAVFANRFPALVGQGTGPIEPNGTLLPAVPAVGRCEVICFDPRHELSFTDLPVDQVRLVIEAWADRTAELSRRPDVVQVFCFENRGEEIGVTQHHPHGQIYAYPVVLPRTARMLARAVTYRRDHATNLFDDIVAVEVADGARVVTSNEHWVAFVPFAAHWPYELHLYPRKRVPDLPSLDAAQRDSLAEIYLDVLGRFNGLFPTPTPYIAAWHQAPSGTPGREELPAPGASQRSLRSEERTLGAGREEFALHLELFTNRRSPTALKYLAGTEAGMDMFSNDVVPEDAARRLREVSPHA